MNLSGLAPNTRRTIGGDICVSPDLKRKTVGAEFIAVFEDEGGARILLPYLRVRGAVPGPRPRHPGATPQDNRGRAAVIAVFEGRRGHLRELPVCGNRNFAHKI
jgi:hypothetical protein